MNDLAISSPEMIYIGRNVGTGRVLPKFAKKSSEFEPNATKRVLNRGIAGIDIFAMLEASDAVWEA